MSSLVRYVDHTYRDYSRYVKDGGELLKHKKSGNNFPARLHRVLSDEENADVITWMVSLLNIMMCAVILVYYINYS